MQLNTLIEILIEMKISIIAMWGMGHDSFNGIQRRCCMKEGLRAGEAW